MFRTKCKEHDHSEFYKFLQMEPTPKNNDCYFFYYSTCTKGDNCAFRHEPSALGCEVMCSYWQQGNCLNEHCNFRHMELKKNRKLIPCFWETQRGGCKKPHCPFLHAVPRASPDADAATTKTEVVATKPPLHEWSTLIGDDGKYDGSGCESDQGRGSSEAGSFIGSPAVDPLIVNFDEESDSESAPSPVKPHTSRVPYCKTYEEIRLEEIQAESAAYYSYEPHDYLGTAGGGKDKRMTSVRAARLSASLYSREKSGSATTPTATLTSTTGKTSASSNFTILTLDEIRRRKAAARSSTNKTNEPATVERSTIPQRRTQPVPETETKKSVDFLKDAIKTLAEIKAANSTKIVEKVSRKRTAKTAELHGNDDGNCNDGNNVVKTSKVPPIRLRRSPKKLACRRDVFSEAATAETTTAGSSADVADSSKSREDSIEVRLCDSSTSDDAQSLSNVSKPINRQTDEINAVRDDVKFEQLCDTNLSTNDDDYLTNVDTGSDDILNDIDALLKEKPEGKV